MVGINRLIVVLFLVLLIISGNLNALTVVDVSDEQLTAKAEMILIGKVLSAYCAKDSGDGEIYTYISIHVEDRIKGKFGSSEIVLKTAGGQVNDEIVSFPGAADFYRNEEVLLFLERRNDGSLMPIGMMLGKYSIYRDSDTGKKIVLRNSDGNGHYFSTPRSASAEVKTDQKLFLNDFRDRIRKMVEGGKQL